MRTSRAGVLHVAASAAAVAACGAIGMALAAWPAKRVAAARLESLELPA